MPYSISFGTRFGMDNLRQSIQSFQPTEWVRLPYKHLPASSTAPLSQTHIYLTLKYRWLNTELNPTHSSCRKQRGCSALISHWVTTVARGCAELELGQSWMLSSDIQQKHEELQPLTAARGHLQGWNFALNYSPTGNNFPIQQQPITLRTILSFTCTTSRIPPYVLAGDLSNLFWKLRHTPISVLAFYASSQKNRQTSAIQAPENKGLHLYDWTQASSAIWDTLRHPRYTWGWQKSHKAYGSSSWRPGDPTGYPRVSQMVIDAKA